MGAWIVCGFKVGVGGQCTLCFICPKKICLKNNVFLAILGEIEVNWFKFALDGVYLTLPPHIFLFK